jgi:lipopolysaccharide export system protein LptA
MKWLGLTAVAAATVAAGMIAGASAQIAPVDAPVEVTADRVEAIRSEGRAVYTGNVTAVQGQTQIRSDKLTVICARAETPAGAPADESCLQIEQMIAEGNVFYVTAEERIRGDRAEYDYRSDTITMTGDVILSRGEEAVIRGTKVVYSVAEGRATVTADRKPVVSIFTPVERTEPSPP